MKNTTYLRGDFFKQISLYKIPGNRRQMYEFVKTVGLLDPTIYPILLIMAEYPITDITINRVDTSNLTKNTLDSYEETLKHKLFVEQDITGHLMDIGIDIATFGNSFVSPSSNILRMAVCEKCGAKHKLSEFGKVKVKVDTSIPAGKKRDKEKKLKFTGKCPECGYEGDLHIEEIPAINRKMIKWPIENIDLDYTEYDGHYTYYYEPSRNLRTLLGKHNAHMLDTADNSLIYSILTRKKLKLNNVYHFKARGSSMIWPGWALPPILPVLTTVWYMNLLMRAQEAVALDFLVPLRLLYYQNTDSNGNVRTSAKKIKRTLENEIKAWRKDPNRVVTLPFPVQQLELMYGGRNLLLAPELQAAQQRIAMGLGFPPTVLTGDMTYSGGSITLRMLANRFSTLTAAYRRYLNEFYKKYMFSPEYSSNFELGMTKFQIADDVAKMQLLVGNNLVSKPTMYEMLGLDAQDEYTRKLSEIKQEAMLQSEAQQIQTAAGMAAQVKQVMDSGVQDPKNIELSLLDPGQQVLKFVADFMALPAKQQEIVAQKLAAEAPETWKAMNEVMMANGIKGSMYPIGAPQEQQGQPSNGQQGGNTKQGGAKSSETESSRGKLFKDKQRPNGNA